MTLLYSGTDKQKDVWFCVTAIRKSKESCPECKAVEEIIIENAFVKAFNILCTDNKTVVEEVVIGGYNEDGIPDPSMLTFIFKTGLNTKIDGHKPLSKMKKNTASQKCTYQEDKPR